MASLKKNLKFLCVNCYFPFQVFSYIEYISMKHFISFLKQMIRKKKIKVSSQKQCLELKTHYHLIPFVTVQNEI